MNHKELVRIAYNEMVEQLPYVPTPALHDAAARIARKITYSIEEQAEWVNPEPSVVEPPRTISLLPTPKRKAIAATVTTNHYSGWQTMTAVCDDGTIWTKGHDGLWSKAPPIPQD